MKSLPILCPECGASVPLECSQKVTDTFIHENKVFQRHEYWCPHCGNWFGVDLTLVVESWEYNP